MSFIYEPDLIVYDECYIDVADDSYGRGKKLDEILKKYLTILEEIRNEAITDGEVADALILYIETVMLLKDNIKDVSESVKNVAKGFVVDFNNADSYLF